ncbi:MAG: hypothetical protein S4CHLAM7_01800 [Chlamydiae bacterium]|nr:hypothetical protein [Chlamydiota bacterium]
MEFTRPILSKSYENTEPNIGLGKDYFVVNAIRNFLCIPSKIYYWDPAYASGCVSDQTTKRVSDYLQFNELPEIKVSINEYAPLSNAYRCMTNPKTSLLSKLTLGFYSSALYALSIPKLTGLFYIDTYDYASNTVHLFSDKPDVALFLAARAHYETDSDKSIYRAFFNKNSVLKHETCSQQMEYVLDYLREIKAPLSEIRAARRNISDFYRRELHDPAASALEQYNELFNF